MKQVVYISFPRGDRHLPSSDGDNGRQKKDLIFISLLMKWISWIDILRQSNETTQLTAEIWNILSCYRRRDSNLLLFIFSSPRSFIQFLQVRKCSLMPPLPLFFNHIYITRWQQLQIGTFILTPNKHLNLASAHSVHENLFPPFHSRLVPPHRNGLNTPQCPGHGDHSPQTQVTYSVVLREFSPFWKADLSHSLESNVGHSSNKSKVYSPRKYHHQFLLKSFID